MEKYIVLYKNVKEESNLLRTYKVGRIFFVPELKFEDSHCMVVEIAKGVFYRIINERPFIIS